MIKGLLIIGTVAGAVLLISQVAAAKSYLQGDVNGDGQVDMGDVITVERIILGYPGPDGLPYPKDWIKRADVNGDGEVNMADVVAIERIILGLPITTGIVPSVYGESLGII